jgi:predicted MFS family arabinose efflux permease
MTSATDSQPMLLGVAQFVFVAAIAAAAPAIVQRVSSLVQDNPGTAVALYACSMFIGASLGPQLVRAFLPGGFSTIMLMLAAVLVIGASAALLATRLGQSKQLS